MTVPTQPSLPRWLIPAGAAAVVLAMLAGVAIGYTLASSDKPSSVSQATPTTPATTTPAAAPTSEVPTVAPSPALVEDGPHKLGESVVVKDVVDVTVTAYAYRQPVAKGAPKPDGQPGYVWGAVDVKVCLAKDASDIIYVSNSPWSLAYADGTYAEPSHIGYAQFPQPEYPWGEKTVAPGRCVRGWITFPVPGNARPEYIEYAPENVTVPIRWSVG